MRNMIQIIYDLWFNICHLLVTILPDSDIDFKMDIFRFPCHTRNVPEGLGPRVSARRS